MDNIHDKVECRKTDPAQADTSEPREHDRRALGVMTVILGNNMLTRFSMGGTKNPISDEITCVETHFP